MREVIAAIEGEYRRYRRLGADTLDQLTAEQLCTRVSPESNSLATIVWHISGNLESRFTDFLTTDGEKPWRKREDEFARREATPPEIHDKWDRGWETLTTTLAGLTDADLQKSVTIRGVEFTVAEALLRSVAHASYHVGQMTFVGKMLRGEDWTYLSIPPGGTAAYNLDPTHEKG